MLILYTTDDGRSQIQLRADQQTVWLTQAEIAELFGITPQTATRHIQAIYADGELSREATCTEYVQVRSANERQVRRRLNSFSLDMIMARPRAKATAEDFSVVRSMGQAR